MKLCSDCDGNGYAEYEVAVPMSFSVSSGHVNSEWAECETCMGAGEIEEEDDED